MENEGAAIMSKGYGAKIGKSAESTPSCVLILQVDGVEIDPQYHIDRNCDVLPIEYDLLIVMFVNINITITIIVFVLNQ